MALDTSLCSMGAMAVVLGWWVCAPRLPQPFEEAGRQISASSAHFSGSNGKECHSPSSVMVHHSDSEWEGSLSRRVLSTALSFA